MNYDYTNKDDMRKLADAVRAMPAPAFEKIAPAIMAGDLMRARRIIYWMVWLIKCCFKMSDYDAWSFFNRKMNGELFSSLQERTADHIEYGMDVYDRRSAGGLCAEEVETLVELIEAGSLMVRAA